MLTTKAVCDIYLVVIIGNYAGWKTKDTLNVCVGEYEFHVWYKIRGEQTDKTPHDVVVVMGNLTDRKYQYQAWFSSLQWRHNGCDGVLNHQLHDCLLNRLSRLRIKKTSKLCVTGLCVGNSPVTGPRTYGQSRGKCLHLMTSLWCQKWFNSSICHCIVCCWYRR